MATTTGSAQPELLAQYNNSSTASPSEPFTFTTPLPSLPSAADSSAPPTAYLRAVRAAISATQAQINEALTSRMEEDKARDAAAAVAAGAEAGENGGKTGKSNKRKKAKVEVDEEAEEMNYGEEVVEED